MPPPSLLLGGTATDGLQFGHALSVRLRPDYCLHQFVIAYGGLSPLRDLSLRVQFGRDGIEVQESDLTIASIGGELLDERFMVIGLNAPCTVDEVRLVEASALQGEQTIALGQGLTLTQAALTDLNLTQGLPLEQPDASTFDAIGLAVVSDERCLLANANLRAGPSTSNDILATLQATATSPLEVLIIASVEDGDWLEIDTPTGRGFLYHTLLSSCP